MKTYIKQYKKGDSLTKKKVDYVLFNAEEVVTVSGASQEPKRGEQLEELSIINNGAVAILEGKILDIGTNKSIAFSYEPKKKANYLDCKGKIVMPGFIDSHTHLVHFGSRSHEYESKIKGESYSTVHKGGGGIHYSVACTRKASFDILYSQALKDANTMLAYGTTTIESKSGYGLNKEAEEKILSVGNELNKSHEAEIINTFLGAHTVPKEFANKREQYINLVKEMIPLFAEKKLSIFVDVFCDPLGFDLDETKEILTCAKKHGMLLKLHAEQTAYNGGAELGAQLGAVSVDHLDYIGIPKRKDSEKTIIDDCAAKKMAHSKTIGVLLPGVTHHLMEMNPKAKTQKMFLPDTVRMLIDTYVPIALATDYNPGSCRCLSMQTIAELAARLYKMSCPEIINAMTINAAHALNIADRLGSIEIGKQADLVILNCPTHQDFIDFYGVNKVDTVIKSGKKVT